MRTLKSARPLVEHDRENATLADYHAWAQKMNLLINKHPATLPPPTEIDRRARPAIAYANFGEWVADCPDECGGAEVVEPGWPFMCCHCGNKLLSGRWRRVEWPKDVAAITRALDDRPFDRFRHWVPGEPMKQTEKDTEELRARLGRGA